MRYTLTRACHCCLSCTHSKFRPSGRWSGTCVKQLSSLHRRASSSFHLFVPLLSCSQFTTFNFFSFLDCSTKITLFRLSTAQRRIYNATRFSRRKERRYTQHGRNHKKPLNSIFPHVGLDFDTLSWLFRTLLRLRYETDFHISIGARLTLNWDEKCILIRYRNSSHWFSRERTPSIFWLS